MQQMLVTVRYRLKGDPLRFRNDMERTAAAIAATPGLAWKIWGLDTGRGVGVSAYLFESPAAAAAFAAGPVVKRLRQRPDVAEVSLELAAVDRALSLRTGAATALSAAEPARQLEGAAS